jgi:hypothetical protein
MDSATPNNPNKRVRFTETTEGQGILRTPAKQSNNVFSSFVVSLLPAISSLAQHFHKRYIKLRISALQQSTKIEKLSNDEFILRSTSFKFKLGATPRLEESEQFKSLAESTSDKVKKLQDELKADVLATAKLEDKLIQQDTKALYCEAISKLGTISLLAKVTHDSISDDLLTKFVMYSIAKDQRSLKYIFLNFEDFDKTFKKYKPNNIKVVFDTQGADMSGADASDAFAAHLARIEQKTDTDDSMSSDDDNTDINVMKINNTQLYTNTFSLSTMTEYQHLLYQTFHASWKAYLADHNSKMLNTKLQRYATLAIETKATDDVTRQLNSEPTVDPTTLKDLIRQNVEKETKELKDKLHRLEQQSKRTVKKVSRGDKARSRASPKKKQKLAPTKPTKRTGTPTKKRTSSPRTTAQRNTSATPPARRSNHGKADLAVAAEPATQQKQRSKPKKNKTRRATGTKNKQQTK